MEAISSILGALKPSKGLWRLADGCLEDGATVLVGGSEGSHASYAITILIYPAVFVHRHGGGVGSCLGVGLGQADGGKNTFHVAQLEGIFTLDFLQTH